MTQQFEHEWQAWALQCVHPGMNEANRETLRVSFYSGAMIYARLIARIRVANDGADALAMLDELHDEMREYAEGLIARYGKPGDNGTVMEH